MDEQEIKKKLAQLNKDKALVDETEKEVKESFAEIKAIGEEMKKENAAEEKLAQEAGAPEDAKEDAVEITKVMKQLDYLIDAHDD